MSETPRCENHLLDARLRKEKEDAINQINHVRNVLQQIKRGKPSSEPLISFNSYAVNKNHSI